MTSPQSLSDKLKALGVKLGANDLPPAPGQQEPQPSASFTAYPIEEVVDGQIIKTDAGPVFCVEKFYPLDYDHGNSRLQPSTPLDRLAQWAEHPQAAASPLPAITCLDTETSGLAGGAGTFAFLVGAGKLEEDGFRLRQFFMRDPSEEPALLLALEAFLVPCQVLVTFNGKSFDAPLLNTRYRLQGWNSPLKGLAHFDLLHLSRRIWRERLPSRTLGSLEAEILQVRRGQDEVPGWMIPQLYFDYLHTGDSRPLSGVFYHNALDILSLAALLDYLGRLLYAPQETQVPALDRAALARLYEDLEENEAAVELYRRSLKEGLPESSFRDTLQRFSLLLKRMGRLEAAEKLWQQAAAEGEIYACVELAKLFEHQRADPPQALVWCEQALRHLERLPLVERRLWRQELEHRQQRLIRKGQRSDPPTEVQTENKAKNDESRYD